MFNIGSGELVLIAVVALLVLGPKRLPELARGLGKFLREFRRQTDEVRGVVEREFYKMDQEMDAPPPQLTAAAGTVPASSEPAVAADDEAPIDHSDPRHPDYGKPDPHDEPASLPVEHAASGAQIEPVVDPRLASGAEPGIAGPAASGAQVEPVVDPRPASGAEPGIAGPAGSSPEPVAASPAVAVPEKKAS